MIKTSSNVFLGMLVGFLGFFFLCLVSFEEEKGDLFFILKHNPIDKKTARERITLTLDEVSEIKIALKGVIRFYQLFISSQDKSVCNFTISCSRFSNYAIQKFGIVHGLIMSSDRIQRCNGLGRKYYPIDSDTGLAIDYPVDDYFLGKIKKRTVSYKHMFR